MAPTSACFITSDALLSHWQAHRRLTRRTIEAFPDDRLFTFSLGGMRTFGELALEMASIGPPMLRGLTTGVWEDSRDRSPRPKQALLALWDEGTREMDERWKSVPADKFSATMTAFGQYTAPLHDLILYAIDNEIHHRGQGFVYLRALGIEPPAFYDRS